MESIDYSETEYEIIETQEMDEQLQFKLVKFTTGYYGVINHNPKTNKEEVILLSPEKDQENENISIFGGLGCKSFMIFARDTKKYMENAPIELVVMLGQDAPEEYREIITKDQSHTLFEKVEICHEIMSMKIENSFNYKYCDYIETAFKCVTILLFIIVILNTLHSHGVI